MMGCVHRDRRLLLGTGAVVITAGLVLGVVRFFGEPPPGQDVEAAVGAAAFGAVIAAPGALALLATRGRPALALPAAVLLVPLSFVSFALVTLPLLIPAFLLLRVVLRTFQEGAAMRALASSAAVLTLLVAACIALFVSEDPREHATATTVYGTSDVVTYAEAAGSLILTTTAVVAGWRLAAPAVRRPTS
jgi:hypothetical protein